MTSDRYRAPAAGPSPSARWIALAVLFLSLAMSLIDLTVANIALPSIRAGLNPSEAAQSWIVAGYALAYALSLVPGGRLGDRYGHKWIFLIGTTMYVATGTCVVTADNDVQLVAFRLLHGVAGGLMIPAVAALIQVLFQGRDRARAYGFYAFVVSFAALVGPLVGGWIIERVGMADGWRYALAHGLGLGVLAVLLGLPLLPGKSAGQQDAGRFDTAGSVLMALTVMGFFVPLIQISNGKVAWWAPFSALGALVLLAAFVLWERHLERTGGSPLLPPSLFRDKRFSFGLGTAFLTFASFTGSIYIAFAVLWQSGRGEGALAAALVILPFSLGSSIGPLMADRFAVRLKGWVIPASLAMLSGGYLVNYFLLVADPYLSAVSLLAPLAVAGFGSGVFFGLNMSSTLSAVPGHNAGSAVGMLATGQRIGAALGSAVVILLISQPGRGGPADFGAETMLHTGTRSVLFCAVIAGAALVVSLVEVWATAEAKPLRHGLA